MNTDNLRGMMSTEERLAARDRRSELESLPPGHPLRVAMEEAKSRLEEKEEIERQAKVREEERRVRRGEREKKVKKRRADAEQEDQRRTRRDAASKMNDSIDKLRDEVARFVGQMGKARDGLRGVPGTTVRLDRLERMCLAFMKGITDQRVNPQRLFDLEE